MILKEVTFVIAEKLTNDYKEYPDGKIKTFATYQIEHVNKEYSRQIQFEVHIAISLLYFLQLIILMQDYDTEIKPQKWNGFKWRNEIPEDADFGNFQCT